ncbi:lipocalin family protein [Luteimonas deserti]|uniref:Outer membrane lipoprotein Blc n=1 Tax=Luteimonas deserti TaxID=2752306 RepID=A0A7Z0QT44_9GAMM|nr:lipocalin family protein [Luteimonas deserti]NYZ63255.1 lipocalin family protein [Luteimonas deserti]
MTHHEPPPTVPAVDLQRYLGTWYELARLPMRHEPEDYRDITASYSLNDDGTVRVANRAIDGRGEPQEAIGEATPVEGSHNSKLEVSFLPEGLRWIPFTKGDYWILRLDADYRIALVGSPDRKYLWLMAREPHLPVALRDDYLATARALGYDLADLIHTPQPGLTTGSASDTPPLRR